MQPEYSKATVSTSKSLRREIDRTGKRGPRPEEVVLQKRQAADTKRRREQEAAWEELASEDRAQ